MLQIKKKVNTTEIHDIQISDVVSQINKSLKGKTSKATFFEIVRGPCRGYMDIDYKTDCVNLADLKEKRDEALKNIREVLVDHKTIILDGTRVKKGNHFVSLHVIFPELYFKNSKEAGKYMERFRDRIEFDNSVYAKHGGDKMKLFRLPYAGKLNKGDRKGEQEDYTYMTILGSRGSKKLENVKLEEYSRCCISLVPEGAQLIGEEEDDEEKEQLPRTEEVEEESEAEEEIEVEDGEAEKTETPANKPKRKKPPQVLTIEQITDLLECCIIDGIQEINWKEWRDVIWVLRNESDANGWDLRYLAHEFSEKSETYDEKYTDNVYNTIESTNLKSNQVLRIGTLVDYVRKNYAENFEKWLDKHRRGKQYDVRDETYYFRDFMRKFINTVWDDADEMGDFIRENINRVLARTIGMRGYIIKLSSKNSFHFSDELPSFNVRYWSIDRKGADVIVSIDFKYELKNKYINLLTLYDEVEFLPRGVFAENTFAKSNNFDMWTGFRANLLPRNEVDSEIIAPMLKHVKEVVANDSEDIFNYILTWLHHIFTRPEKKTKTAILLKSDLQQVGKGIFIEFLINYVFGEALGVSVSGLKDITARFNENVINKIFVNCDELSSIDSGLSYNAVFDIIKKIITDGTTTNELKGGKKWNPPDFKNLILCTQHDFTVKIEAGDSRYCAFECSPKYRGNRQYFDGLETAVFNQNAGNHFISYVAYGMFVPEGTALRNIKDIPQTELRQDMINMSLPSSVQFINEIYDQFTLWAEVKEDDNVSTPWFVDMVPIATLYEKYRDFCIETGERHQMKAVIFSKEMKKIGIVQGRSTKTRHWDLLSYLNNRKK